ncbi:MAG: glycosyltransferase family 8 protein [Bacteroidales bacterium]|nr:glycosyltransferase family 8 protein [Bacteroidales bacterium]
MKDPIHILCASDDAYVPYYGIMMTSLFENNRTEHFSVHMMTSGLREEAVSLLQGVVKSYANEIHFLTIDDSLFADCPIRPGDHVTLATYYRLIAANVLPDSISKVLWLDGDMIVNNAIRPLWETELNGFAIAAVTDESYTNPDLYQRLQLDSSIPYTSAGVLLINLDYWRMVQASNRFIECIRHKSESLLFHDQDTLNIVLQNEKKRLPLTWNFQSGFFTSWYYPYYPAPFQQEILQAAENPGIIHYTGPTKPWFKNSLHPYRAYFEKYKALSPWKGLPNNSFGPIKDFQDWTGKVLRMMKLRPSSYIIKDHNP